MNISKYPVISDNGNEYEVGISEDGWAMLKANVYECEEGRFGVKRRKSVYSTHVFQSTWGTDYVRFAIRAVKEHEESIARQLLMERQQAEGIEAFTEWNGKC